MPEPEFEIYLSVLSRLLKLTPEQTSSIEDELRDHLEERFEELVRSGIERDVAIRQALDEFGDASGLAVNLTRVSQKPVRRWVVGSSIVSAAALLVTATLFLTSEPDGVSLPGSSTAVAQAQSSLPSPVDLQLLLLDPQPDDLELAQLTSPSSVDFGPEITLEAAVRHLSDEHEVPIVLDPRMLQEGVVSRDQPLNPPPAVCSPENRSERAAAWPHAVTLAQVLDVLLREVDLTWEVRDGIIVVTSADVAGDSANLITRSYNIEPLTRSGTSVDSVIEVLQTSTNGMWERIDGSGGQISRVGNVLTVRQTYQSQREIRQVLRKLVQPGESPWIRYADQQESLARLLKQPWSVELPPEAPLRELVEQLSVELDVPMLIDPMMLRDGIAAEDDSISLPPLADAPVEAVFRLAFEELGLVLVLQNGLPTVTSADIASDSRQQAIGVYDVREFLQAGVDRTEFENAVQSMAGGHWNELHGEGGTLTLTENGLLVVSQRGGIHRSLQRLLATWRKGWKEGNLPSENESTAPVTKFYHMPIETAVSLKDVIPEMVAPESWKSEGKPHGGTIHAVALTQSLPQESSPGKSGTDSSGKKNPQGGNQTARAGDGPSLMLAQFGGGGLGGGAMGGGGPGGGGFGGTGDNVLWFCSQSTGVLVITQTPAVHREIDRFLASLRVSTRGRDEASSGDVDRKQMGGGGGFF